MPREVQQPDGNPAVDDLGARHDGRVRRSFQELENSVSESPGRDGGAARRQAVHVLADTRPLRGGRGDSREGCARGRILAQGKVMQILLVQ